MGYTHYFRRLPGERPAAFRAFSRDCWRLFETCEALGIALAGPLGVGAPEVCADAVTFNGAAPQDYETFLWARVVTPWDTGAPAGALVFECCKTAQRPYDVAVVAALLLAESHYGAAVRLSSDGDAPELAPALELLRAAFPDRAFSLRPFVGAGGSAVAAPA